MPAHQQQTGVDLHGEGLAREHEEQRRQLETAHRDLNYAAPVTDRLIAQNYGNQTTWNYQTVNYGAAAYQEFTAYDAFANYHQSNGQDQLTANSAAARNYETDVVTDQLVDIIDGEDKNKKKKKKKKKAANRL